MTFDPATSSIGPYEAKTKPVQNRCADLVLLSHGHIDHCRNIADVTRPPEKSIFSRIIAWIRARLPFIRKTGDKQVKNDPYPRLLIPAGTEKMLAHIRFLDKKGDVVKALPYDPYLIQRNGADVATVVPILSKHWSGTSPLNGHKAPALGYLVITNGKTVFFAGDTGYEKDMYMAVADIARQYQTSIDHIFLPAGPDHKRYQMEKTHQATIDAVNSQLLSQTIPTYQALATQWATADADNVQPDETDTIKTGLSRKQLTELLKRTSTTFIHSGHYKLGNIHAEDPFICMIDLISAYFYGKSKYLDSEAHLAHLSEMDKTCEKDALDRVRADMQSPAYQACQQAVIEQFKDRIHNSKVGLTLLLQQLLSQAPPGHVRPVGGNDSHQWIDTLVDMVDKGTFDISKLSLKTFSNWYQTPPARRTGEQLFNSFGLH